VLAYPGHDKDDVPVGFRRRPRDVTPVESAIFLGMISYKPGGL